MPGSFMLYADKSYGKFLEQVLNVTGYMENTVIPLAQHDKMSSLSWVLPPGVQVVFFKHSNGSGDQYPITGTGGDPDVHDNAFGDRASSWLWRRV